MVEYHKYVSELEVALHQHTQCCSWILNHWNYCRNGEDMGCDVVQEWMAVEHYHTWLQNHHPAVVRMINIQFILCGHDGGEWCMCQCRSMSLRGKNNVDKYPCFLTKIRCCKILRTLLTVLYLLMPVQPGWSSETAAPLITFYKEGSYHCRRISLICLHMFAKYLIALSFPSPLGSC